MCVVCLEWEKNKLTNKERKNAMLELVRTEDIDVEHYIEIVEQLEEEKDGS